ncbi:response regulator [uncultured Oscillibacter sp.]|uniref:response regulator n=1 Tax=uncultured Oscillibacter sp. TaxID=876091 RepID=UPI002614113A|nr:response regulator [uncultured Oscillibacter sp.]
MRKILLVDDSSAIAQEPAKLLKRRGYGVQTTVTVAGAKEVIEKERPLFISSDLDLPDGSGLELLDMVQAADADFPSSHLSFFVSIEK